MRPFNDYLEDSEEFEDFSYTRSQALGKLIREHRREARIRHENRYHDNSKDRRHHKSWDWDWQDEDDWDSYLDDSSTEAYEGMHGHY